MVIDSSPAFLAARSNAMLLYQPGVPPRVSVGSFSKETPIVSAPYSKAAVMRLASPYPVEHPKTRTKDGPLPPSFTVFVFLFAFWETAYAICSSVSFAHPAGCALMQMLLRIIG